MHTHNYVRFKHSWAKKSYCLAKAVYSLARIRLANCPFGVRGPVSRVRCHGVQKCLELSAESCINSLSFRFP